MAGLFADRTDAGGRLAEVLGAKGITKPVVIAILRGGALVDDIICLRGSSLVPFAVANFYRHWHGLTDEEVRAHLARLGGE